MQFLDVNILAILAAAVVNIIVGTVWYSHAIFGEAWTNLTGKKREGYYVATFLAAILTAYVLALLIEATDSSGIEAGTLLGLLTGAGFAATSTAINFLFEKRPLKLYLITGGHHLLSYMFMGAILGGLA